ncbi:MAG: tRNA pseudouridine(55) synthase TruB [Cyanobacteria bacterium SIG28]|nr:tRNA pseudouridine(55) synthase TruB [Cyanobacteria bacterium SIG28]
MFGFLNIYKPQGKTSHDVVAVLRRVTKIKQIGHTGTLDPFAEGVLPICIGKATRLIEYLNDDKAYIGTVQFGKTTTTYDTEGEIVKTSNKKISLIDIENCLPQFRGEIQQLPPIYSAIKVKGKKLYEYARNGEEVEIQPRSVNIHKLEIIDFDEENQTLQLHIECSKGTYIRSIAHDLGENLGCGGHLIKLVRTKAGKFELNKAVNLDELQTIEQVKSKLIYPLDYLDYNKYELNSDEKEKVSHGMAININSKDGTVILTQNNELIAVAEVENNKAKISKVFI